MKKKLQEMLARKEARKAELIEKSKTSADVAELRSINTELEALNGDIADIRATIIVIDTNGDDDVCPKCGAEVDEDDKFCPACGAPLDAARSAKPKGEKRGTAAPEGGGAAPPPQGDFKPLGTYQVGARGADPNQSQQRNTDFAQMSYEGLLAAPEYRTAYLKRLQEKPLDEVEQRALTAEAEKRATTTGGASAGAAVPTTTYNKIIEKLRQTSVLFPLIQATYIPGNVTLPVANALNAARWSDEVVEGTADDDNVLPVTLAGYTLAKYAKLSIAVQVMTVDAFEAYVVNQVGAQLAIALENAILNGLGPTPGGGLKPQPTGILPGLAFAWDAANSLTYPVAGVGYDDFVNTRALLHTMYRPGAMWVMNSNMEAAVMKIKSSTGKPIFSQDPQNGFIQKILNILYAVDDYMPDDTILLARFDYYYMNFSQAPVIEADKSAGFSSASILYRGLLIADGKPALSEAFVKLTKAA